MKSTLSQKRKYVVLLERFNGLLLSHPQSNMVLMNVDQRKPIAVISPNITEGLVPAIISGIKEDKCIDDSVIEIIKVSEHDSGYLLSIEVQIDDNGDIYTDTYEGYFV